MMCEPAGNLWLFLAFLLGFAPSNAFDPLGDCFGGDAGNLSSLGSRVVIGTSTLGGVSDGQALNEDVDLDPLGVSFGDDAGRFVVIGTSTFGAASDRRALNEDADLDPLGVSFGDDDASGVYSLGCVVIGTSTLGAVSDGRALREDGDTGR